jgi:hypothetical protein
MKKLFFLSVLALATISCSGKKSPSNIKNTINECVGKSSILANTEQIKEGKSNYKYYPEKIEMLKKLAKMGIIKLEELGESNYDVKINPKYVNNTPSDGSVDERIKNMISGRDNVKICDLKVEEVKNLKFQELGGVQMVSVDAVLVPTDDKIKIEPITKRLSLQNDGNGGDYKFCKD